MNTTHKRLFLGVDGGASKIAVVVMDEGGHVLLEETTALGANYQALDVATVVENLEVAVQSAVQQVGLRPAMFDYSVFGLAGCNFDSDHHVLTEALRKSALSSIVSGGFAVVNDSQVALRAGTKDGIGVVLIAGTGSNCFGRDEKGNTAQAGGWNHLLSDEGSGYDIGLRTLQAVMHSLDGRSGETALTAAVFKFLGVDSLESLYREVYANFASKSQIASLAKITVEVAERRDAEAQDILNHSVNELLLMVDAVLQRLAWRDSAVPVVAVGSVIGSRNYVRQRFQVELLRIAPRARLVLPKASSAEGAAMMALEARR
jgi:N-acetylglucosamine kinase-like BadF-type ATPase